MNDSLIADMKHDLDRYENQGLRLFQRDGKVTTDITLQEIERIKGFLELVALAVGAIGS